MRFLDVRTDYAFKKVFGSEESKPILISFLNSIIDFADGSKITASIDPASLRAEPGAAGLPIRLIPETSLATNQIGQLAKLTIIKKSPF